LSEILKYFYNTPHQVCLHEPDYGHQFIEIANCTCLIYYITVVLYSVFASSSVIFTFCHQLTPGNVKTVVSRHDPSSPQMCTLCLMFQC